MVQWLGLCASTAGGMGSIPGQGTKMLHAVCVAEKNKNKTEENWPQPLEGCSALFLYFSFYFLKDAECHAKEFRLYLVV